MRFLTPVLLIAAAAFVHHSNATSMGRVILFPFIDALVPSTEGDPRAMGEASVHALLLLGGVTLLAALFREAQARRVDRALLEDD